MGMDDARTTIVRLSGELTASQAREAEKDKLFAEHTRAVGDFLRDLLAVYDPCADETAAIPVKEACAQLIAHATADRQNAYEKDARIAELEADRKVGAKRLIGMVQYADWLERNPGITAEGSEPAKLAALAWASHPTDAKKLDKPQAREAAMQARIVELEADRAEGAREAIAIAREFAGERILDIHGLTLAEAIAKHREWANRSIATLSASQPAHVKQCAP
jgi:hypothetical protein